MLSYLHTFHAGNEADVHKHLALIAVLQYLGRKPAPFCYFDCHAGRGVYDLSSSEARTTGEASRGVLRLAERWPAYRARHNDDPESGLALVDDYLDLLANWSEYEFPRYYPGSPSLAQQLLRRDDRATLLELHPQEHRALRRHFATDRRVAVHRRDWREGLPALTPPRIRRGATLIDPSYELKSEFSEIARRLEQVTQRWPEGIYIVWYPILRAERHLKLIEQLSRLPQERKYRCELRWHAVESDSRPGLTGSGLMILNTPWQFEVAFDAALTHLGATLWRRGSAQHESEFI